MWRYVKAAFFWTPRLPGMGRLPLNLLGVGCLGILGFGHPGFWLLALGLETAYLYLLCANPGFRAWVDARDLESELALKNREAESKRRALIDNLPVKEQERFRDLEKKCQDVLIRLRRDKAEAYAVGGKQEAFQKLMWSYLKLLIACSGLLRLSEATDEADLEREVRELQKELDDAGLSRTARMSKQDTLEIYRRRLGNLQRRETALDEIESDLQRIEARVELAFEDAAMHLDETSVSTDIRVAKFLLEPDLFGAAESAVVDLDKVYGVEENRATPPPLPDTVKE